MNYESIPNCHKNNTNPLKRADGVDDCLCPLNKEKMDFIKQMKKPAQKKNTTTVVLKK